MSGIAPMGSSVLPPVTKKELRNIRKSPEKTAELVGLIYIDCKTASGFFRKKAGKGYYYLDEKGGKCRDKPTFQRIKALVLPPDWKNVWISQDPKSHLQATGIDEAGRKQYRYHEHWNQIRNSAKYYKLLGFAKALPDLRKQVQHDLRTQKDSCAKATALAVRLMEKTCIRVGNQRYRVMNGTSGLTTLDARHVQVKGSTIQFKFTGKKKVKHSISVKDRSLARLVAHFKGLPGRRLFQYVTEDGKRKNLQATHVNEYIQEYTGGGFSAKDFRTWMGTLTAYEFLKQQEPARNATELRRKLNSCYDAVAAQLGNTRAVCKRYYVHPSVIHVFSTGRFPVCVSEAAAEEWLSESEQLVARILASYTG